VGFFYGKAHDSIQWSSNTLNSLDYLSNNDIIEEIGGIYRYYCLILAEFDPLRAEEIYQHSDVDNVTMAIMARFAYNRKDNA
jgi:hypothetical protein